MVTDFSITPLYATFLVQHSTAASSVHQKQHISGEILYMIDRVGEVTQFIYDGVAHVWSGRTSRRPLRGSGQDFSRTG